MQLRTTGISDAKGEGKVEFLSLGRTVSASGQAPRPKQGALRFRPSVVVVVSNRGTRA